MGIFDRISVKRAEWSHSFLKSEAHSAFKVPAPDFFYGSNDPLSLLLFPKSDFLLFAYLRHFHNFRGTQHRRINWALSFCEGFARTQPDTLQEVVYSLFIFLLLLILNNQPLIILQTMYHTRQFRGRQALINLMRPDRLLNFPLIPLHRLGTLRAHYYYAVDILERTQAFVKWIERRQYTSGRYFRTNLPPFLIWTLKTQPRIQRICLLWRLHLTIPLRICL